MKIFNEEYLPFTDLSEEMQEQQGFVVDNDEKANWLLQKLKAKEKEKEKFELFYKMKIEKTATEFESFKAYAEGQLKMYAYTNDVLFHETKTERKYALPDGEIKFKKPKLVMEKDDTALLEELKTKGLTDYIKIETKEKVDWAGLKKNLIADETGTAIIATTGEILDTVKQIETEEEFIIKY